MTDITGKVDQLLAERRPDRYHTDGGDEWLDEIADEIEMLIPEAEARAVAARQIVRRREGQKTKDSNRLMRSIHDSGQLPMDWLETLRLPIVVGKERVAMRAATAVDFRAFANEERRRAANDFASRNATCEAAEWIADLMDANGFDFGSDIHI